jgi:hypothetical protein
MSGKMAVSLFCLLCSCSASCFADDPPAPTAAPAPEPAPPAESTTAADAKPVSDSPSPAAPRKKGLLDFNRDGKITLKDALRVAGFHGSFDRIASVGYDGRLTLRNPKKLLGEALLDLADDGKINPRAPLDYIGLPLMNINGFARLSYKGRRLILQRTWKY